MVQDREEWVSNYPNIPMTDHPNPLLEVEDLPEKIVALDVSRNKVHIAEEGGFYQDGETERCKCICGRKVKSVWKLNRLEMNYVIEGFCFGCLSKLDEMMLNAMYDSLEEEWYFIE